MRKKPVDNVIYPTVINITQQPAPPASPPKQLPPKQKPPKQVPPTQQNNEAVAGSVGLTKACEHGDTHVIGNTSYTAGGLTNKEMCLC